MITRQTDLGTGGLFLRRLRAKVSDEPTGFVWMEDGKVAASGYPASRSQVEWISCRGIGSILTLTENPLPNEWVEGLPLRVEHLPIKDHVVPDPEILDRAVDYIQAQLDDGRAVLVHCLAGEGRTGCVLAAYLIREKKMDADSALRTIRSVKPAFVEWKQQRALLDYAGRPVRGTK